MPLKAQHHPNEPHETARTAPKPSSWDGIELPHGRVVQRIGDTTSATRATRRETRTRQGRVDPQCDNSWGRSVAPWSTRSTTTRTIHEVYEVCPSMRSNLGKKGSYLRSCKTKASVFTFECAFSGHPPEPPFLLSWRLARYRYPG